MAYVVNERENESHWTPHYCIALCGYVFIIHVKNLINQ